MKYKYSLGFILIIFIFFICSGCGWGLRNANKIPSPLKVLYLDIQNPDSTLSVNLKTILQSLEITLTKTPEEAPLRLHIFNYLFKHNSPAVVSSNVAITYIFTMSVMVELTDSHGRSITSHPIQASSSLTVNANQIFTINSATIIQQQLQREISSLIYFWLINQQTQRSLISFQEKTHADHP